MKSYIKPFGQISMQDFPSVGGKNALLGDMLQHLKPSGINIPDGFAITVEAFYDFLAFNSLSPQIQEVLNRLNRTTFTNLYEVGADCRRMIMAANFPEGLKRAIHQAYEELISKEPGESVAVRSSATAEDSPTASFAGQHDSYLNIKGFEQVLQAVKQCYASVFNDRAIKYRNENGFPDLRVGMSVAVQIMVRSDRGSAGVIFTAEPETLNQNLLYLTGAWGLGEGVVQGAINTDEYYLFKAALIKGSNPIVYRSCGDKEQRLVYDSSHIMPTVWQNTPAALLGQYILSDKEIITLGKWSLEIEQHYGAPMDIEWAKDGITGALFIVQARMETVHSHHKPDKIREYTLLPDARPLLSGKAIGHTIVSGKVCNVKSLADGDRVKKDDIIVVDTIHPDWYLLLSKAAGIVTNKGVKTSHASILARELGVPAVVGTGRATEILQDGQEITLSCATGDVGNIYAGKLASQVKGMDLESMPATKIHPMLVLADAQQALWYENFLVKGVAILQVESLIRNNLQIDFQTYNKPVFIDKLAEAVGLIAASFYPREVVVQLSSSIRADTGAVEKEEVLPADKRLDLSGESWYDPDAKLERFSNECAAIRKVRENMLLDNVMVVVPKCNTLEEAQEALEVLAGFGLKRKENGLAIYLMASSDDDPQLAETLAQLFDGFFIQVNQLPQLMPGLFHGNTAAALQLIKEQHQTNTYQQLAILVKLAHSNGGKAVFAVDMPQVPPAVIHLLVSYGIDAICFNPSALIQGIYDVSAAESVRDLM